MHLKLIIFCSISASIIPSIISTPEDEYVDESAEASRMKAQAQKVEAALDKKLDRKFADLVADYQDRELKHFHGTSEEKLAMKDAIKERESQIEEQYLDKDLRKFESKVEELVSLEDKHSSEMNDALLQDDEKKMKLLFQEQIAKLEEELKTPGISASVKEHIKMELRKLLVEQKNEQGNFIKEKKNEERLARQKERELRAKGRGVINEDGSKVEDNYTFWVPRLGFAVIFLDLFLMSLRGVNIVFSRY